MFVRGCLCLGTDVGLATGHSAYLSVPLPWPRPHLCTIAVVPLALLPKDAAKIKCYILL